jgi:ferrochelatase
MTPSFVADCLETLEEIGIRLRRQWDGLGGEDLLLVGCLNATPVWTAALAGMVRGVAWSAV